MIMNASFLMNAPPPKKRSNATNIGKRIPPNKIIFIEVEESPQRISVRGNPPS